MRISPLALRLALGLVVASGLVTGCGSSDSGGVAPPPVNVKPSWLGTITATTYDGVTDDLLTAGLGKTGLGTATAPATDPTNPAQLRRLAIHTNYRALVDPTANGGYGTLYGPNVTAAGVVTSGEGLIAGTEFIAYADDGTGAQNVTLMVQLPATFNAAAPCVVTATSSGSRGIYGAIATAGEWGLKRGCAVAYADKGSGNGVHDLQNNTVNLQNGLRAAAATAGRDSNFTAALTESERSTFNAATPNRFAVKHAHSQQNPEKDWGRDTLRAVEFAFFVLNDRFSAPNPDGSKPVVIRPANTLVIASSVSNGAGAALAAAELDTQGLIDGVAVSEPNVQLASAAPVSIMRGALPPYAAGAKPLYDYFSYANLLQPCAALSAAAVGSPFAFAGASVTLATNRCAALAARGLVTGATTQAQADDAMARLLAYGWEPETALLQTSHYSFATLAIATTYSNTYGRFSVRDNLCGYSFGAVDGTGAPVAASAAAIASVFGTGNGVPPSGAIQIINNAAVGGPRSSAASVSASTGLADFNVDGALCQRALWTGSDASATRVKQGIAEVGRNANLRGKPAIIVHGRNDTLIPTNFSSRPYFAQNQVAEGAASRLRYIEVTNAQHFDSFLPFAGYDTRFVPLHVYFNRAMDAMWEHLRNGTALPPSQVVRTTPRGGTPGAAPAVTASNVPALQANPATADRISFSGGVLTIPQ
ncbi:MAG: D-(-)-3-hydroxybutyrate oligomer hydrolase [Betaproteobacteria bacterium]